MLEIEDEFAWLDDHTHNISWSCHMESAAPHRLLHDDWMPILEMPPDPVYTSKFVIKGQRCAMKTTVTSHTDKKQIRKRRRKDSTEKIHKPLAAKVTLGPQCIQVQSADSIEDACQKVVNALAGILPLDVKMNVFGFWHSVILVAVFYRHDNLCWVLLNRINYKLYITAHFVADSLHLFTTVRQHMQLSKEHKMKKWTRQGVSDVMCFFKTAEAMQKNQSIKLNTLPSGVLRFSYTQNSLEEVNEFLRGSGSGGHLLRNFTRTQVLPPGFDPITRQLTDSTRGWKVFKRSSKTGCKGGAKRPCSCDLISRRLVEGGIGELKDTDAALRLIEAVPSSLDKPSCRPLNEHFHEFIDYVKKNPSLVYMPGKDEYV